MFFCEQMMMCKLHTDDVNAELTTSTFIIKVTSTGTQILIIYFKNEVGIQVKKGTDMIVIHYNSVTKFLLGIL